MSSSWFETAYAYLSAGNSVLPATEQKHPPFPWDIYKQRPPTIGELAVWGTDGYTRFGIVTGAVSEREMIDFDNKSECVAAGFGAAEVFLAWALLVEEGAPGLMERITIEQTPSGGVHGHYRCRSIEGNTKLARYCTNPEAEPRDRRVYALIETRGEGGFTVVAPSPGYVITQGDIASPATITADERGVLIGAARALNRYIEPERTKGETRHRVGSATGPRPGDDYNRRATCEQVLDIMERGGWTVVRRLSDRFRLRRPGKDDGQSATLFADPCTLYVFSSNAYPFEQETAYAPFGIFAEIEYGGDYRKAARSLGSQGYGTPLAKRRTTDTSLSGRLVDDDAHATWLKGHTATPEERAQWL